MSTLDNIWDEPLAPSSPKSQPQPSPTAPSRQPLFLNDSDDEETYIPRKSNARFKAAPTINNVDVDPALEELDPDIDALFNVEPLRSVDTERLAREAAEKYKNAPLDIPGTSSRHSTSSAEDGTPAATQQNPTQKGKSTKGEDGVLKERKKVVRLDEAKLLSPTGFPELVKRTRDFKLKGKGYETQDLNRLMQIYQFWTHELYPKTTFKDTVNRIEKLCHTKRMNVALSVWRDEANGIAHPTQPGDDSNSSDDEGFPKPKTTETPSTNIEESEPDDHPPSSRPTSVPPSDMEIDDDELEAMIREQEQAAPAKQKASASMDSEMMNIDDIDDQDLWDIVDQVSKKSGAAPSGPQPAPPASEPPAAMDEEDDDGLEYM